MYKCGERPACLTQLQDDCGHISNVMQHEKSKYKILQARNYQQGKETITPLIQGID